MLFHCSTEEFETCDVAWLFGALAIYVVYGHVVDPKASDETKKFADSTSSEALKEEQLTNYG